MFRPPRACHGAPLDASRRLVHPAPCRGLRGATARCITMPAGTEA